MSIIGVGIDVAEIERFRASLERTPGLAQRLFLEGELLLPSGERRGVAFAGRAVRGEGGARQGAGCSGRAALDGRGGLRRGQRAALAAGDGDGGRARGGTRGAVMACVAQS